MAVRLDLPVARLGRQAAEALRSSSAIGSEIGGFLIGTVTAEMPVRVTVTDYELIACDYGRGPLYKLNKADLDRFDQAIAEHDFDSRGRKVVGFFRSHTRQGTLPDNDDLAVCSVRFSRPYQIALLVRPGATELGGADIFVWQGGALVPYAKPIESYSPAATINPAPLRSTPVAQRLPSTAPTREVPKRALVVPILSRRPQLPIPEPGPAPAATLAPTPEFAAVSAPPPLPPPPPAKLPDASGKARVGRCCMKMRLEPDPRRSQSNARRESSRRIL